MLRNYPLVNIQKTMERSTIFIGKTNYFDWAIFNSYVTNYQGTSFLHAYMTEPNLFKPR
jgi:hypothetical protein